MLVACCEGSVMDSGRGALVESLDGIHTGRYSVTTVSNAVYVLDLDEGTFVRHQGLVSSDDPDVLPSAALRGDGEGGKLHYADVRVGSRATLVIGLDVPGVAFTTRITTEVIAIVRVEDGDGGA